MRRRRHTIHLVHRSLSGARTLEDIESFSFEEGIEHHFPERFGRMAFPVADFVFGRVPWLAPEHGRRMLWVQGFSRGADKHLRWMRAPYPKICVSRWLVSAGVAAGIPRHELVHVPLGLDHDRFRVVKPIANRPPRIAMMYGNNPLKGMRDGLKRSLREGTNAGRRGNRVRKGPLPSKHRFARWDHRPGESVARTAQGVYNDSGIYLCPSIS